MVGTSDGFVTTGWCGRWCYIDWNSSVGSPPGKTFYFEPPNCVLLNNWCWLKKLQNTTTSLTENAFFLTCSLPLSHIPLSYSLPTSLSTHNINTHTHTLSSHSLILSIFHFRLFLTKKTEDYETFFLFFSSMTKCLHSIFFLFSLEVFFFRLRDTYLSFYVCCL